MAAEGAKARDPSGRRRCLRGRTVNCWDVQHRVAEALTVGVGVAGCQAKFWRADPRNDGRLQGGWGGERSFFLIARHESPSGLPPEPAVVDHESAVLDDLDAGAGERLGDLVMANAELHPDHTPPGGEDIG